MERTEHAVPAQLPVTSGALAIFDPADKKSWKVFDRPAGAGQFRIMLSIVDRRSADATKDELAAIVIHVGRPPIARWTVAHWKGQKKPKSADELPRIGEHRVDRADRCERRLARRARACRRRSNGRSRSRSRSPMAGARSRFRRGKGEFAAYWAVDAQDKPICLVIDFDAFTQKDWKAKPT